MTHHTDSFTYRRNEAFIFLFFVYTTAKQLLEGVGSEATDTLPLFGNFCDITNAKVYTLYRLVFVMSQNEYLLPTYKKKPPEDGHILGRNQGGA